MGVASLVLGIFSLIIAIFTMGIYGWLAIILGVIGIVLGAVARKNNPEKQGLATAGLVCSIIGVSLSLLVIVACAACVSSATTAANAL